MYIQKPEVIDISNAVKLIFRKLGSPLLLRPSAHSSATIVNRTTRKIRYTTKLTTIVIIKRNFTFSSSSVEYCADNLINPNHHICKYKSYNMGEYPVSFFHLYLLSEILYIKIANPKINAGASLRSHQ